MTKVEIYTPTSHRLRMLVYGSSGVGKTMFGNTAPKPLFLAAEEGLLTLSDAGVRCVKIMSMQDLQNVLYALEKNNLKDEKGEPLECETIVIDSLTEIQQVVIENITGGRSPSQREWGKFADQMAQILKGFKKLDKHLIFICLEKKAQIEADDGNEFTHFSMELFGKLAEKTCAQMDLVGRYYMRTTVVNDKPTSERTLSFQHSPRWMAKDRSGKLGQFVAPDFSAILKACKIEVGTPKVVTEIEDVGSNGKPVVPPSNDPNDKPATYEIKQEIKKKWEGMVDMALIPKDKMESMQRAMLIRDYKIDTTVKLRQSQAEDHIKKLDEFIAKKVDEPMQAEEDSKKDIAELHTMKTKQEAENWYKAFLGQTPAPHPERLKRVTDGYHAYLKEFNGAEGDGQMSAEDFGDAIAPEEDKQSDYVNEDGSPVVPDGVEEVQVAENQKFEKGDAVSVNGDNITAILERREELRKEKIQPLRDMCKEKGMKAPTTKKKEELIDYLIEQEFKQ